MLTGDNAEISMRWCEQCHYISEGYQAGKGYFLLLFLKVIITIINTRGEGEKIQGKRLRVSESEKKLRIVDTRILLEARFVSLLS